MSDRQNMKESVGKSIQAEGRALGRQKELWLVQQTVGSSGKLDRELGVRRDGRNSSNKSGSSGLLGQEVMIQEEHAAHHSPVLHPHPQS